MSRREFPADQKTFESTKYVRPGSGDPSVHILSDRGTCEVTLTINGQRLVMSGNSARRLGVALTHHADHIGHTAEMMMVNERVEHV